jgi:hypothetical protein
MYRFEQTVLMNSLKSEHPVASSFDTENCFLMCIFDSTLYVLGKWQKHLEAIDAWHVVWYLTPKMKQTVMKNSILEWFGNPQPARQQHPSDRKKCQL